MGYVFPLFQHHPSPQDVASFEISWIFQNIETHWEVGTNRGESGHKGSCLKTDGLKMNTGN